MTSENALFNFLSNLYRDVENRLHPHLINLFVTKYAVVVKRDLKTFNSNFAAKVLKFFLANPISCIKYLVFIATKFLKYNFDILINMPAYDFATLDYKNDYVCIWLCYFSKTVIPSFNFDMWFKDLLYFGGEIFHWTRKTGGYATCYYTM